MGFDLFASFASFEHEAKNISKFNDVETGTNTNKASFASFGPEANKGVMFDVLNVELTTFASFASFASWFIESLQMKQTQKGAISGLLSTGRFPASRSPEGFELASFPSGLNAHLIGSEPEEDWFLFQRQVTPPSGQSAILGGNFYGI